MPHARGTGDTQHYSSVAYDQADGAPSLNVLNSIEEFSGDIEATVTYRFLQLLRADGTADFCGLGRVVGTIGGQTGSFAVQDKGQLRGDVISGTWWIMDDSGTGELDGIRGQGTFLRHVGGSATWELDYEIDPPRN